MAQRFKHQEARAEAAATEIEKDEAKAVIRAARQRQAAEGKTIVTVKQRSIFLEQ